MNFPKCPPPAAIITDEPTLFVAKPTYPTSPQKLRPTRECARVIHWRSVFAVTDGDASDEITLDALTATIAQLNDKAEAEAERLADEKAEVARLQAEIDRLESIKSGCSAVDVSV